MNRFKNMSLSARHCLLGAVERAKFASSAFGQKPSADQRKILRDLSEEGVHITSLDRLFGDTGAAEHYRRAAAFVADPGTFRNDTLWCQGQSSRDVTALALLSHLPGVYLAGLEQGLLSLVQQYLRKPAAYHGSVVRHSQVDGLAVSTRMWHRDAEDNRVFRMVVYLNDVEPGGGPFEYIHRQLGISYRHFAGAGLISNELMNTVVPKHHWKQVYGPAGTVVLCDTGQTFHHESIQESRPRSVVMVGYSSRRPRGIELAMGHFPAEQAKSALAGLLQPDHAPYVFGWRDAGVARASQKFSARDRRIEVATSPLA